MAIADYLRKLVELKNQLVANLNSMGVTADESEKLNTLVPKVLECKTEQNVEFVEGTDFTGVTSMNDHPGIVKSITKIKIPPGTTKIGEYAFEWCTRLTEVIIPDTVTEIGNSAFHYCALKTVILPASVTTIHYYAFSSCPSLSDIYYTGTEEQWNALSKSFLNHTGASNVNIHYNYVPE